MSRTKWMGNIAFTFIGLITLGASALAQSPAAQPLTPELMKAIESITADMWPVIPVIPTMATGGTGGRFLNNVGIWTYGVSGIFTPPEGSNAHGLDEKLPVKSLYEEHEFLWRLGKRLVKV